MAGLASTASEAACVSSVRRRAWALPRSNAAPAAATTPLRNGWCIREQGAVRCEHWAAPAAARSSSPCTATSGAPVAVSSSSSSSAGGGSLQPGQAPGLAGRRRRGAAPHAAVAEPAAATQLLQHCLPSSTPAGGHADPRQPRASAAHRAAVAEHAGELAHAMPSGSNGSAGLHVGAAATALRLNGVSAASAVAQQQLDVATLLLLQQSTLAPPPGDAAPHANGQLHPASSAVAPAAGAENGTAAALARLGALPGDGPNHFILQPQPPPSGEVPAPTKAAPQQHHQQPAEAKPQRRQRRQQQGSTGPEAHAASVRASLQHAPPPPPPPPPPTPAGPGHRHRQRSTSSSSSSSSSNGMHPAHTQQPGHLLAVAHVIDSTTSPLPDSLGAASSAAGSAGGKGAHSEPPAITCLVGRYGLPLMRPPTRAAAAPTRPPAAPAPTAATAVRVAAAPGRPAGHGPQRAASSSSPPRQQHASGAQAPPPLPAQGAKERAGAPPDARDASRGVPASRVTVAAAAPSVREAARAWRARATTVKRFLAGQPHPPPSAPSRSGRRAAAQQQQQVVEAGDAGSKQRRAPPWRIPQQRVRMSVSRTGQLDLLAALPAAPAAAPPAPTLLPPQLTAADAGPGQPAEALALRHSEQQHQDQDLWPWREEGGDSSSQAAAAATCVYIPQREAFRHGAPAAGVEASWDGGRTREFAPFARLRPASDSEGAAALLLATIPTPPAMATATQQQRLQGPGEAGGARQLLVRLRWPPPPLSEPRAGAGGTRASRSQWAEVEPGSSCMLAVAKPPRAAAGGGGSTSTGSSSSGRQTLGRNSLSGGGAGEPQEAAAAAGAAAPALSALRVLRRPLVLVADLAVLAGRCGGDPGGDAALAGFAGVWRRSQQAHPSLLVYTTHRCVSVASHPSRKRSALFSPGFPPAWEASLSS